MAIKCHSSFVHYNMYHDRHCHGGGNNFGSIFNIKHECGGGTGFWGGLGAGLGFGLGGWLSGMFGGFMGGIGNMFGGFGMGNMFGGFGNLFGGFGSFGMGGFSSPFGGSFGSGWGSGWGDGISKLFGDKDKTEKEDKADNDAKPLTDKDYSKINYLHERANALNGKEATKENLDAVNALLDDVNKYELEDENLSPENKEQLKNIKAQLEQIKAGYEKTPEETTPEAESKLPAATAKDSAADPTATDKVKTGVETTPLTESQVAVGGKTTNIDDTTSADALKNMTLQEADKVSKENAVKILDKLNLKNNDGTYKMSTTPAILKLLEKAEVTVACATNTKSKDQWIKGKITNVQQKNDKLSYDIDCKDVKGAAFEYKYSFQEQETKGTFNLTEIDKNSSTKTGYIASDWNTREYKWNEEKEYLEITEAPQISSNSRGREKLEDKATKIQFNS